MVKSEDGRYECSSWRYYLSGTCLFTSSSVVATPFLLLKRRIQMGSQNQSIFSLFKTEGIWGSFRGGSLSWISGANRMLYFTIYEKTVYMFGYSNIQGAHMSSHSKESFINASAAAVSSFVSQAVLTPVSVVTTHMHVHHCPHLSPRQVFLQIVSRNHSWGALWTGATDMNEYMTSYE